MVIEMKKAYGVLALDAIGWMVATIAALKYDHAGLAAAVGAFGIVYVINGILYLRDLQRKVDQVMEEVEAELLQEFNELMGNIEDRRAADLKWESLQQQFEREFLAEQRLHDLEEDERN